VVQVVQKAAKTVMRQKAHRAKVVVHKAKASLAVTVANHAMAAKVATNLSRSLHVLRAKKKPSILTTPSQLR
jgi:hypothetical protein